MPATLTNPVVSLVAEIGGEVVAASGPHSLARIDAQTFVVAGPGPVTDSAWITGELPAGVDWSTEVDEDGGTWWMWITPASSGPVL